MEVTYKIENGPDLLFKQNMFSGNIHLFINNIKQERMKEKGRPWIITLRDGTRKNISIKNTYSFLYEPKIIFDGREVAIDRKLIWWECILCFLPLSLVFIGGAIGALFGLFALVANVHVCRHGYSVITKILLTIFSTAIAVFIYLIIAVIVNNLRT
jgi:hypothetical protein